jgi:DNA-binding NtrC family response regulator
MDKVKIPNAISNQERILVVDDDVFILDTLQNGLTSSGYRCETAINTATALELISKTI